MTLTVVLEVKGDDDNAIVQELNELNDALVKAETDAKIEELEKYREIAEKVALPNEFELPPALVNSIDINGNTAAVLNNNGGSFYQETGKSVVDEGLMEHYGITPEVMNEISSVIRDHESTIGAADDVLTNPNITDEVKDKIIEDKMSKIITDSVDENIPDAQMLQQLYNYATKRTFEDDDSDNDAEEPVIMEEKEKRKLLESTKLFGKYTKDILFGDYATSLEAIARFISDNRTQANNDVNVYTPVNDRILDPWRGTRKERTRSMHSKLKRLGNTWLRAVGVDATNERVRDLINKKLKLMADVFASGYKGMPGTAIGKRRNPAKSRALRALANIVRPKGCRPRGYIAAVANTTPTDLRGLYLNEPEEMAKRWQKRYNEEHADPTPLGLALVNRVTGETIDSIGSLNHVIASSSDFSKIATAPHLAVKNASATGVQSLIRNPMPATQSLGFVSGNDIADSFIRRVNRNNTINDYDEITYYRNIDDRYRNSIEDDLNYLYGAYGYNDE